MDVLNVEGIHVVVNEQLQQSTCDVDARFSVGMFAWMSGHISTNILLPVLQLIIGGAM